MQLRRNEYTNENKLYPLLHPQMANAVEELHGVFQFTDDLFDDAATPERKLTVDLSYTPRHIYPQWFEDPTSNIPASIDTTEYLIPDLYRRREYDQCLVLALERIQKYYTTAGIVRDAAETAALCLLKLSRPLEALPLLNLMTGVEEPGRLIVRSRVFFDCELYEDCIKECREYLKLRPGDYSITIRLAHSLRKLNSSENADEIDSLLNYAESTIITYIEQTKESPRLNDKYIRDLESISIN